MDSHEISKQVEAFRACSEWLGLSGKERIFYIEKTVPFNTNKR